MRTAKQHKYSLPQWKFERAFIDLPDNLDEVCEEQAKAFGTTIDRVKEGYLDAASDEIYKNRWYQVNLRGMTTEGDLCDRDSEECTVIHISIKTIRKEPVHDWRDLQQIKNDLLGPEHEAVELYPAESRLIDTANQYHLWASADPAYRFPVGWAGARAVTSVSSGGAKQRPREEELPNQPDLASG